MPDRTQEHWRIDAGAAELAVLHVPPVLRRDRIVQIDVRFVVRALADASAPWLSIEVEIDGERQWSRRIDAHRPGEPDSLDWHGRRELPAGQGLRVRAITRVGGGARRERLLIEAEVDQPDA